MKSSNLKIKSIKNKSGYKILDVCGDSGDLLDNHKTDRNAILLVRTGSVIYKEEDKIVPLSSGDVHDIPPNVLHKVVFTTNAKFFVVMENNSKLVFEK